MYKTLAELTAACNGRQLYSNGDGRIAIWQPTLSVYIWYAYSDKLGGYEKSGSTNTLPADATPIGIDLIGLLWQLFACVDAKGQPHPTTGKALEVLVPIPARLLQELRAAITPI